MPSELRTVKSCQSPVGLPFSETFHASTTVVVFSRPFHAPVGQIISITIQAERDDVEDVAPLGTVGVSVRQCCDVSDSDHTPQVIGAVGAAGSPASTQTSVTLRNACTFATHHGDDNVYYLRLKIASQLQAVRLSYSVRVAP
jgi:hypothetical protein